MYSPSNEKERAGEMNSPLVLLRIRKVPQQLNSILISTRNNRLLNKQESTPSRWNLNFRQGIGPSVYRSRQISSFRRKIKFKKIFGSHKIVDEYPYCQRGLLTNAWERNDRLLRKLQTTLTYLLFAHQLISSYGESQVEVHRAN